MKYFRVMVDIAVRNDDGDSNPNVNKLLRLFKELEGESLIDEPAGRLLQDRINAGYVDIDGVSNVEDHS